MRIDLRVHTRLSGDNDCDPDALFARARKLEPTMAQRGLALRACARLTAAISRISGSGRGASPSY